MRFPVFLDDKHDYRLATAFIASFLAFFILFNGVAWALGWDRVSVFAASEAMDKYAVRSQLLKEATDSVGSCDVASAAQTWAQGVKQRNGALQYAVMSRRLKEAYATDLETTFPNWVTGVSSPWVDSFKVLSTQEAKEDVFSVKLQFVTATSSGPYASYNTVLTIVNEDGFWRVDQVQTEPGLLPYTGFEK